MVFDNILVQLEGYYSELKQTVFNLKIKTLHEGFIIFNP